MSRLDFEQHIVSNDVDDEPVKRHFESIARLRVPGLERCVQRLLVEHSNVRHELN
jgi:hypothetical protein